MENYGSVSGCKIKITEDVWERLTVGGKPHAHAFKKQGPEQGWCEAEFQSGDGGSNTSRGSLNFQDHLKLRSGVKNLTLLKLTQSGWSEFIKDPYTMLPDTDERLMASAMDIDWSYNLQGDDRLCQALEGVFKSKRQLESDKNGSGEREEGTIAKTSVKQKHIFSGLINTLLHFFIANTQGHLPSL